MRDNMQLISHVLLKLPKDLYSLFITTYQIQGFTNITLFDFQFKIKEYWRSNVKSKGNNYAMTVKQVKKNSNQESTEAINALKSQMEQQIKDLQDIISSIKAEQQKRDSSTW